MTGGSVEIYPGIYRIGAAKKTGELNVNCYLMKDGDEALLFGAGPVTCFDEIYSNISGIIPVDKINYIVLQSHDPLVCAALPLFMKMGFSGKIAAHLRSASFIQYYGINLDFFYTNLSANRLMLKSGRIIHFINTPYLKYAGSFASYDSVSKILFSGDLFGAAVKNWNLYAGNDYMYDMKKYHSEYMPGSNILRYTIDTIRNKDILMIAPHYGSIIKDNVTESISSMMDVQCGMLFLNLKISYTDGKEIESICNDFLKQYYSLFSKTEVFEIFMASGIHINETTGLIDATEFKGTELWNNFFKIIVSRKGFAWINLVEDEFKRIKEEYQIDFPDVYDSALLELSGKYEKIEKERTSLVETLHALEKEYNISSSKILKDPLAQVYREDMFRENLNDDISALRDFGINFAFFIIEIDNLNMLNNKYGREAGDELLSNTAYLLKNFKKSNRDYVHHLIFRMNGPRFTYYCNDITKEEVKSIAEEVRMEFGESKLFITNITVSIGVVHSSDLADTEGDTTAIASAIIELAGSRLRLAKHTGFDSVCSDSETGACFETEDYIMVIDPDISLRYMLKTHLQNAGFNVITCSMGDEALERIDIMKPQLIISEIMLPKIDGFSIRNKLLEESALKDIPFIITSAVKDEKSVIRAQAQGVYHYLKKPYSIIELIGLVKNLSKVES